MASSRQTSRRKRRTGSARRARAKQGVARARRSALALTLARVAPVPAPSVRDADPARLHPAFRDRAARVVQQLQREGIPFRVFEAWRSPQRQRYLWEQGRTRPGGIVTRAQAWESYHQYGLAADFVLFENGQWSWSDAGPRRAWWQRLHAVGRAEGLVALSFELPHLQLDGVTLATLRAGRYPAGGDSDWAENLAAAIQGWRGTPAAPPPPPALVERPPLPAAALVEVAAAPPAAAAPAAGPADVPLVGAREWHSLYGGQAWRSDGRGIYLRGWQGGRSPLRTDGEPVTMRRIWSLLGPQILAAAARHGVPPALIMMVIATETAAYRNFDFTGPFTFRWEPAVEVRDVAPPRFGDYSAGPMQLLATTARWIVATRRLDYDAFRTAPVYERRPEPPDVHPLYDTAVNIDLGAAVIRQRWGRSGDDPVLVAAAYNAGGVYQSGQNPWRLRCYGDHLDRAAKWYGDACAVLAETGVLAAARRGAARRAASRKRGPGRSRGRSPGRDETASRGTAGRRSSRPRTR